MSPGESGFPHPGLLQDTLLADLDLAWIDRENEAVHLKAAVCGSMAAALRAYALKIRIKVMICQRLNLDQLPKACKTHDLIDLIIFTGLWPELNDPANNAVEMNWKVLVEFSRKELNVVRYRPATHLAQADLVVLDAALDDPQNGVHAWLSRPR